MLSASAVWCGLGEVVVFGQIINDNGGDRHGSDDYILTSFW